MDENKKIEEIEKKLEEKTKKLQKIHGRNFIISTIGFYLVFGMLINEMYLYSPFVHWIFIVIFGFISLSTLPKIR